MGESGCAWPLTEPSTCESIHAPVCSGRKWSVGCWIQPASRPISTSLATTMNRSTSIWTTWPGRTA